MATKIQFGVDKRAVQKAVSTHEKLGSKRVRRAAAFANNEAAIKVQKGWREVLKRDLDRPTPFVLRGIYTSKINLNDPKETSITETGVSPEASRSLKYQYFGGVRSPGDAGPAVTHVPVPNWRALLSRTARAAGVKITQNAFGNMGKTAYGRIMKLIDRHTAKPPKQGKARLFFGTIDNVRGIWALPGYKREGAETDGRRLLFGVEKAVKYKPRIRKGFTKVTGQAAGGIGWRIKSELQTALKRMSGS